MIGAALALVLGAAPALAQDWDPGASGEEGRPGPRLFVSAWGGEALDDAGSGGASAVLGGEVAWAFEPLDLGLAAYGYRRLEDAAREWTPVALARLGQRFDTGRGVEAIFTLGIGAGRPDDWEAWYQVAIGVRATFAPLFLGGELSFEQGDLLRLVAGLGVAF